MSYPLIPLHFVGASSVLTAAADLTGGIFTPADPVEIVSFGMVMTVALVSNAAVVLKLDKRVTAGSDTGRTDGTLGTLTIPTTFSAVAGNVVRCRPDSASGAFAGSAPVEAAERLLPGEQAVIECTTAAAGGGAAGTGLPFIVYRTLPYLDRASSIELIVSA